MTGRAEDNEYSLMMPFVTVKSAGGVHDDDSYTAGWEMGQLDCTLRRLWMASEKMKQSTNIDVQELANSGQYRRPIHRVNIAQADLLAMRYGYALAIEEMGTDANPNFQDQTFVWAKFTRPEPDDGEVTGDVEA